MRKGVLRRDHRPRPVIHLKMQMRGGRARVPDERQHVAHTDTFAHFHPYRPRLQVHVAGERAATQIENHSISTQIGEGTRQRIGLRLPRVIGNVVAHENDAGVGYGENFGAVTSIVVHIPAIPMDQLAIVVGPHEVNGEALRDKVAPLELQNACGVMVVASRPLERDPGVAPERRAKAHYVFMDGRSRIPDSRVLRIAGDTEADAVVEFCWKIVRDPRQHQCGRLPGTDDRFRCFHCRRGDWSDMALSIGAMARFRCTRRWT